MKKQIIAIGGGGFGKRAGNGAIEQYILNQACTKKIPNICFIPTATGDDEVYKVNYYATFSKLNCNPIHLDFFKRTVNLEKLIEKQDIVFVGGGNTKSMLAVWKEWGFDIILKCAYENGVVMSGVSAGAICWFEKGITDSWADELNTINCLGFVSGNCCPHYNEERERKIFLRKFLKNKVLNSCYAIESECALHIKNNKIVSAVSFGHNKNSYLVSFKDNKLKEKKHSLINL